MNLKNPFRLQPRESEDEKHLARLDKLISAMRETVEDLRESNNSHGVTSTHRTYSDGQHKQGSKH